MPETEKVSVACPSCGKVYEVPKAALGETGLCPACSFEFLRVPLELTRQGSNQPYGQRLGVAPPQGFHPLAKILIGNTLIAIGIVLSLVLPGRGKWVAVGLMAGIGAAISLHGFWNFDPGWKAWIGGRRFLTKIVPVLLAIGLLIAGAVYWSRYAEAAELAQGRFRGRSTDEWLQLLDSPSVSADTFEAIRAISRESPKAYQAEVFTHLKLRLFARNHVKHGGVFESILREMDTEVRTDAIIDALSIAMTRAEKAPETISLQRLTYEVQRLEALKTPLAMSRVRRLYLGLATIEIKSSYESSAFKRCLTYGMDWPKSKADKRLYIQILEKSRSRGRHAQEAEQIMAILKFLTDQDKEVGEEALRALIKVELDVHKFVKIRDRSRFRQVTVRHSLHPHTRHLLKSQRDRVLALLPALKETHSSAQDKDFFREFEALLGEPP